MGRENHIHLEQHTHQHKATNMSCSNKLIPRQCGYQTICPDEENVIGYFEMQDTKGAVYGWKLPSMAPSSKKEDITYRVWREGIWGWKEKHNKRDGHTWVQIKVDREKFWIPRAMY